MKVPVRPRPNNLPVTLNSNMSAIIVEMRFTKPRALREGDTVGIIAPSDWFLPRRFDEGVRVIKSWGLRVEFGKHIFERVADFMAGEARARAEDLKRMIYDDKIKVIWAAEGGYAAPDIRGFLTEKEFSHLRGKPKWIIGYSDVGVLTNAFFANGLMSVYGPNVWGLTYWKPDSLEWLRKILFGEKIMFPETGKVIIPGRATGLLLASNLDSLFANLGTKYDPLLRGEGDVILFLEEWRFDLASVVRQIEAIFDHARFERVRGLILGRFPQPMPVSYSDWARSSDVVRQIRARLLQRKKIPLITVPYFGHPSIGYNSVGVGQEDGLAMPCGVRVSLSGTKKVKLSWLERVTA